MSYAAQELNKRIGLLRLVQVIDPDTGYRTDEWVVFGEAFAKFEPLVGREYIQAMATQSESLAKFTMRYRADLGPDDRLRHDGKDWEIRSVINPKGRNRETLVMAKTLE